MSKNDDSPKIEAGQILHPECFPAPNELVCIQVPKVFDQVALRDCVTRCIPLRHHRGDNAAGPADVGCGCPNLTYEGVTDFDITEIKVLSRTDSLTRPGFKKIKLFVKVKYTVHFLEGDTPRCKEDEAAFNLTVNEIYCPSCIAQIGVIRSDEGEDDGYDHHKHNRVLDVDGSIIKVEALVEAFNDAINQNGILTLDLGAFFIVKCECIVQLLIPAYGYCPVPPEQRNAAALNCNIFNDRLRTPFPTQFFPNQKWNPLDREEEHHC